MEKGGTRHVVRSLNALSVHTAGTGGKQAVAPQGDFSEACFLFPHLPCFLFPRSVGFLSLMGCSFLQRAQDRGWWGREADRRFVQMQQLQNALFNSVCTSVLLYFL